MFDFSVIVTLGYIVIALSISNAKRYGHCNEVNTFEMNRNENLLSISR